MNSAGGINGRSARSASVRSKLAIGDEDDGKPHSGAEKLWTPLTPPLSAYFHAPLINEAWFCFRGELVSAPPLKLVFCGAVARDA